MNAPEKPGLSPAQERYMVLTHECGLEHEEALHALGRRTGGFPEYRKLSRQAQLNKVHELISYGLTEGEAERVVGVPTSQPARKPAPPRPDNSDAVLVELASRSSKPGKPPHQCFHCREVSTDLAYMPERVWLCKKCRTLLRKARKAHKHQRELNAYYDALTHPEYRGLKGVRK